MNGKYLITVGALCVLMSALIFILHHFIPAYSLYFLCGGNLFMALLSVISYLLVVMQLNKRPEAFVRGVFAGTFFKILICMFTLLIYVVVNRHNLYKPALFVLFGVYAVYTYAETNILFRMAKNVK
jgi:hypothetical protein